MLAQATQRAFFDKPRHALTLYGASAEAATTASAATTANVNMRSDVYIANRVAVAAPIAGINLIQHVRYYGVRRGLGDEGGVPRCAVLLAAAKLGREADCAACLTCPTPRLFRLFGELAFRA